MIFISKAVYFFVSWIFLNKNNYNGLLKKTNIKVLLKINNKIYWFQQLYLFLIICWKFKWISRKEWIKKNKIFNINNNSLQKEIENNINKNNTIEINNTILLPNIKTNKLINSEEGSNCNLTDVKGMNKNSTT